MKDEVLTIKLGECAIVLARTYLYIVGAIVLTGLLFLKYDAWVNKETIPVYEIKISETWEDYLSDCGSDVLQKNALKYSYNFIQKYEHKTINWDGYYMKSTDYTNNFFRGDHAYVILLKMQPSESDLHADLILSLDDSSWKDNREVASSLASGDHVQFEASFITAGNEHRLPHLHL